VVFTVSTVSAQDKATYYEPVAPMSLTTYDDARPWARAIARKVKAREMPPWFAEGPRGAFSNERGLSDKEIDDAVKVLELNVEAYPKSANAYDSLGESYMVRGDRALAIANYRRSLGLDPRNANAVEQLKKLGESR
jgi:tetratricopeptide (TPR) repeat protein